MSRPAFGLEAFGRAGPLPEGEVAGVEKHEVGSDGNLAMPRDDWGIVNCSFVVAVPIASLKDGITAMGIETASGVVSQLRVRIIVRKRVASTRANSIVASRYQIIKEMTGMHEGAK